jgi:NAD(P)-dependent dehydrogenase (short-subunit alcohol dehydrogenase family)
MKCTANVILTRQPAREAVGRLAVPLVAPKRGSMRDLALVTGASGAVGSAVALALVRQGFDIALHFHSNRHRAERLASEIATLAPDTVVHLVQADLAMPGAGAAVIDQLMVLGRSPSVLVLNASPPPVAVAVTDVDWGRDILPQLEAVVRGSLELVVSSGCSVTSFAVSRTSGGRPTSSRRAHFKPYCGHLRWNSGHAGSR